MNSPRKRKYLELNSAKSLSGEGMLLPETWMLCPFRKIASLYPRKESKTTMLKQKLKALLQRNNMKNKK